MPPRPEKLRRGRRKSEQDAHHRHEDAHIDACPDTDAGKIERAVTPRHDGVDKAVCHDGNLADEHRPAETKNVLEEAFRHIGERETKSPPEAGCEPFIVPTAPGL